LAGAGFCYGFFGDKDKKAERSYREFLEAGKDQGHRPELVGGGLIRSMGGWSQVLTLRKQGLKSELSGKRPLFHEHSSLEDNRFPTMILLDLNMPRKDGRQTLKEIKSNPRLLNIPIVIFTTSKEEKDKCFVMKAGADLFITKPSNYEEWVQIMASLAERWLS
jgi:CheY-like chemotaxis protein